MQKYTNFNKLYKTYEDLFCFFIFKNKTENVSYQSIQKQRNCMKRFKISQLV